MSLLTTPEPFDGQRAHRAQQEREAAQQRALHAFGPRPSPRARVAATIVAAVLALGVGVAAATNRATKHVRVTLFAQPALLSCLRADARAPMPSAHVDISPGDTSDTATVTVEHVRPGTDFDLFAIRHSPQTTTGAAATSSSVGRSWFRARVHVDALGNGSATYRTEHADRAVRTVRLDHNANLSLANPYHLGLWFDDPAPARPCGFRGSTRFNVRRRAGPLAFVTRPSAVSDAGPLCTRSVSAIGGPVTCTR